MNYLLDTSVVLSIIRSRDFRKTVTQNYLKGNTPMISVVSLGELRSLAMRNKWGENKWNYMSEILKLFLVVDIHVEDIVQKYAEIDTFSQGKLEEKPLPNGLSSRNMGKNDLWIAASAAVLSATLLTLDKDFEHLDKVYFDVVILERA